MRMRCANVDYRGLIVVWFGLPAKDELAGLWHVDAASEGQNSIRVLSCRVIGILAYPVGPPLLWNIIGFQFILQEHLIGS